MSNLSFALILTVRILSFEVSINKFHFLWLYDQDGKAFPIADVPYDSDWGKTDLTLSTIQARNSGLAILGLRLEKLIAENADKLAQGQTICISVSTLTHSESYAVQMIKLIVTY